MCMITYIPAGIELPLDGIRNGGQTNDDGHGWAVANATEIRVGHSMNLETAINEMVAARQEMGGGAVVFHSRWATHGEYGLFNVHPFSVTSNSVMAHNGILPRKYLPSKGERRSDTRLFVDRVAKDVVGANGIPSRRMAKRIAEEIGYGNKLVFLGVGPVVRIVNAWAGEWVNGVWYSNTGYRPRVSYTSNWRNWWANETGSALGYPRASVEPVRTFEPVTRKGVRVRAGLATCGDCGGLNLDYRNGVCRDCWYCLDCDNAIAECDCFIPESVKDGCGACPNPSYANVWEC